MSPLVRLVAGASLLAGASVAAISQSVAAPVGQPLAMSAPNSTLTQQVYWRGRGWGWGPGPFFGGLAAGAIIGGALAAPYSYGPYYGPYYGPAYAPPPGYAPPPAYGPPPGDAVAYCMQRYRSYDPNSGTFLGYDGNRHPCP
jgi:BA14K-like protein